MYKRLISLVMTLCMVVCLIAPAMGTDTFRVYKEGNEDAAANFGTLDAALAHAKSLCDEYITAQTHALIYIDNGSAEYRYELRGTKAFGDSYAGIVLRTDDRTLAETASASTVFTSMGEVFLEDLNNQADATIVARFAQERVGYTYMESFRFPTVADTLNFLQDTSAYSTYDRADVFSRLWDAESNAYVQVRRESGNAGVPVIGFTFRDTQENVAAQRQQFLEWCEEWGYAPATEYYGYANNDGSDTSREEQKSGTLAQVLAWATEAADRYNCVKTMEANVNNPAHHLRATKGDKTFFFFGNDEGAYNEVKEWCSAKGYTIDENGGGNSGGNGTPGFDKVDRTKNVTVCIFTGVPKGEEGPETYQTCFTGDKANDVLQQARDYVASNNLYSAIYYVYLCSGNAGDLNTKAGDHINIYMVGENWTYPCAITHEDGVRMSIRTGRYGAGATAAMEYYSGCCYTYDEETKTYTVGKVSHKQVFDSSHIVPGDDSQHYYTQFECSNCGKMIRYTLHPERITDIERAPDVTTTTCGIALEACRVSGCTYHGKWLFKPMYLSARLADETFIAMNTGFSPEKTMTPSTWEFEHRDHGYTAKDIVIYDLQANYSCVGDLTVPTGKTVWLRTDIYGKTYGDEDTHKAAVFDGAFLFETPDNGTLVVREGLYVNDPSAYVPFDEGYSVVRVSGRAYGDSHAILYLVYRGEMKDKGNFGISISGGWEQMMQAGRQTLEDFETISKMWLEASKIDGTGHSWNITPWLTSWHVVQGEGERRPINTHNYAITIRIPINEAAWRQEGQILKVTHTKDDNTTETLHATVVKIGDAYYAQFSNKGGFSAFTLEDVEINGVALTGSVTSWDDAEQTTVLLYSGDTTKDTILTDVKDGAPSGMLYTAAVTGTADNADNEKKSDHTFALQNVPTGDYKLVFYRPNYVPVIQDLAVNETGANVDASRLYLKGDALDDGTVNAFDQQAIYSHINKSALLSEEEETAADVNGDGKVNVIDQQMIYQYVAHGQISW